MSSSSWLQYAINSVSIILLLTKLMILESVLLDTILSATVEESLYEQGHARMFCYYVILKRAIFLYRMDF